MSNRRHTDTRTGEVTEDPQIRPFSAWLQDQSKGATHEELSEALYDLIARVTDTGKVGTLTLSIKVEPLKEDRSILVVTDEIKLKLPEFARPHSIFYRDAQGNLTRQNPDQPEISGLREVPAAGPVDPSTIREAN